MSDERADFLKRAAESFKPGPKMPTYRGGHLRSAPARSSHYTSRFPEYVVREVLGMSAQIPVSFVALFQHLVQKGPSWTESERDAFLLCFTQFVDWHYPASTAPTGEDETGGHFLDVAPLGAVLADPATYAAKKVYT